MTEFELKIEEIPQQHVGNGRAIIDPKIIEDAKWNTNSGQSSTKLTLCIWQ